MSKPNRNNKEKDNNKRPLESNDDNATLVLTPKKKALDVFRAKIQTTPEKVYNRKNGVLLTKVIEEDGTVVGVSVEGAYLARSYLLGQMNSTYLMFLAFNSKKKLELLPMRGKYWKEDSLMSVLVPPLNISHVDFLVSKTTKEKGNGAVLLYTALQLLELDADKDFGVEVYEKLKRFFSETKMPPDDQSSAIGFIKSAEQAEQKWNEWSPWTVTEEVFELNTENEVDAFLQIAYNNKV
jgi:hypothetical protein